MPIVLSTHWTEKFSTIGDQAFLGITMSLVGIVLVFAVLIVLSLFIGMMSKMINGSGKSNDEIAPDADKPVISAPVAKSSMIQGDQGSIIAAITAAIQMILAQEGSNSSSAGFRIKKIRRV